MATLHRIYCYLSQNLTCGSLIELPAPQSLHVKVVLRLKKHDKLIIFNEIDGSFLGLIEESSGLCRVFLEKLLTNPEILKPLIVGMPLIKKHRFSAILEAATQLSATKVVPVRFARGQIFNAKEDKIYKQIISSVEQCGRHTIPELGESLTIEEFVDFYPFIVCANEKSSMPLSKIGEFIPKSNSVAVLVGPEGGFSEKEQKLLNNSANVTNVSLGDFILRSETAITFLLAQIKFFY